MKDVVIYTDGACKGNPGPGGWGAWLRSGGHEREIWGGEAQTTNNRMELTAVIESLAALKAPSRVTLHLDSEAGGPPDLRAWLAALPRDTGVYGCGPAPMLEAFERGCAELGLADAHIERFAAAPAAADAAPAGAYTVVLERRGLTLEVSPGKGLLDTLLDAGVDVPYSCMEGVCGTCETRVLEGEIEHRDGVLSAVEKKRGDVMMVCVSSCKGPRLVLDL